MEIPITQSDAWEKLQRDLREKAILRVGNGYQYLAIIKQTPIGNYLYCPYGPVTEDNSAFKEALENLKSQAIAQNAFFIRIEPQNPNFGKLLPGNAKKTKDLNPKETWVMSLEGEEEQFKEKLPSRLLRYHKAAAKKGITLRSTKKPDEIRHLIELQKTLAREKGINTFSEHYLKTELSQPFATLYLVEYESPEDEEETKKKGVTTRQATGTESNKKQILAAGLVFDDETTRYNLQGAQSELGRKMHATGILTIEIIKDARKKGLKYFDFWGIAPEGAPKNHPWAGFTEFKKTFRGETRNYLGTYDLPLNPIKYTAYQTLRKLNRIKRRIKSS